jgi:superfamily II DNA or RNA helicase
MSYSIGTLVRARGREWVVLPDSDDQMLVLRPLGGTDDEIAGVLTALEPVEPATFALPTADDLGDHRSAQLLRDALRLGFRSSAGPFRSFGSLNFEPRPYQLVPLMMSLRLDPVRLLIADDVGTGKTASTLMIAAELLAQGKAKRMTVLCPPHLATQWQAEMRDKFHLDAEVVLPSNASRLERGCRVGETLFDRHDITIVSTEFIKADRRRSEFLRTAPELVIVDEAHTCAFDNTARGGRHIRHQLVEGLAANPNRHLLLVTATPHSGKEEAFRSLLTFLDAEFAELPDDLSGDAHRRDRERLARHMVQRRRADLRKFLQVDTPFPDRKESESAYRLSAEGHDLFDAALAFAREAVRDSGEAQHRQRMRWWSALALLRSLASSPAAALDTLEKRSKAADTTSVADADAVGRRTVLDLADDDAEELDDEAAGSDDDDNSTRRRLNELKKLAAAVSGKNDTKLQGLVSLVKGLLDDGFNPIVFCRYIPTADYVAQELAKRFPKAGVRAVSGRIPSSERPEIVDELAPFQQRILVTTDCLSEGINLQALFDSVVHYDLSWNPTRHEQREGRVDRFGQPKPEVRVLTYYGSDNRVDGLVLEVLLRKHRTIRNSLGYSVPVPGDANTVAEAIIQGLLLQDDRSRGTQLRLEGMDPAAVEVLKDWESAADREKRSRTVFAQEGIKPDEVAIELAEVRQALGTSLDVKRFVVDALTASGAHANGTTVVGLELGEVAVSLREAMGLDRTSIKVRFEPPATESEILLTRTHPIVSGLAAHVLDTALDPLRRSPASRSGVIRTDAVTTRTTLLVARYRFDLFVGAEANQLLAEDAAVLAFTGDPNQPDWLDPEQAELLLAAQPVANVASGQAREVVDEMLGAAAGWLPQLDEYAREAANRLLHSHHRARAAVRLRTSSDRVEARLPVDVLGLYVLLPGKRAA